MAEQASSECEICGAHDWKKVREGAVRAGSFGKFSDEGAIIWRCGYCGVERLDEKNCHGDEIYASKDYRVLLEQAQDAGGFLEQNDHLQLEKLDQIWPISLRDKVVADVGCAAGSFLDHVSGLAGKTIAIEPCIEYHNSLANRGHTVFPSCEAAIKAEFPAMDFIFSFSVIEHVANPRTFLTDLSQLMAPSSRLLISTPNRNDVLMGLLPDDYPAFFYRTVHRWYFDQESFIRCAELSGLKVLESRCVHRFGLSNAMIWLRDRKPGGILSLPSVSALMDSCWQASLAQAGTGDYLYFWLEKSA